MRVFFALLFTFLTTVTLRAQTNINLPADKIVAVIGSRYIAMSDIDNYFAQIKEGNDTLGSSAKCDIMFNFISQKVLAEMAWRDSVEVSEDMVEAELNDRIQSNIRHFGSKEMLEMRLGKSVYQIKEEYRDEIREQLTAQRMQQILTSTVTVTPDEVKKVFDEIAADGELPYIPATLEVGQIIINPKANPEVEEYTRKRLEDIRQQIVSGEKEFSIMAGIVSEDPGSRDEGGLIEINNKDLFDPAFVAAAFRLQPGEISPVFRSSFGYHIIQMEKKDLNTAVVRHILLVPPVTSVELAELLQQMDSVRADLMSGKLSYTKAIREVSNDDIAKSRSGMIFNQYTGSTQLTLDQLDPTTVEMIKNMKVGEYSEPHIFSNYYKNGNQAVRILYLKNRIDPHTADLKTDYTLFQNIALQEKKFKIIEDYIFESAKSMYIRLDPMYQNCEKLKPLYSLGQASK